MSNKADRAGSPSSSRVTFIGLQNSLISNSEEVLTIRESNMTSLIPREQSFGDKIIDLVTAIYTMALNTIANHAFNSLLDLSRAVLENRVDFLLVINDIMEGTETFIVVQEVSDVGVVTSEELRG